MKTWYKIGLFFVCIIIICLMIVVLWQRHAYPNYSSNKIQEEQELKLNDNTAHNNMAEKKEMSPVTQTKETTTCDTVCLYEEINQTDNSIIIEEMQLPEKYIGMTREELEYALKNDNSITLEEKKKGLISQHLESFSSEVVKIIRIYDVTDEEVGYYIMVQEQHVCVFKADRQTLYFQSGILLEDLPLAVQEEVIAGKYMSSEMEVFHFLESYSS